MTPLKQLSCRWNQKQKNLLHTARLFAKRFWREGRLACIVAMAAVAAYGGTQHTAKDGSPVVAMVGVIALVWTWLVVATTVACMLAMQRRARHTETPAAPPPTPPPVLVAPSPVPPPPVVVAPSPVPRASPQPTDVGMPSPACLHRTAVKARGSNQWVTKFRCTECGHTFTARNTVATHTATNVPMLQARGIGPGVVAGPPTLARAGRRPQASSECEGRAWKQCISAIQCCRVFSLPMNIIMFMASARFNSHNSTQHSFDYEYQVVQH